VSSKKATERDYGLPEIGNSNVAASLVRQRSDRTDRAAEEEPAHGAVPPGLSQANEDVGDIRPTEPTKPIVRIPDREPIGPEPVVRRAGRPKGPPSRRMHLAIDEKIAAYLNRAWRTHERPDGTLASGPADLVEDLLAEHRRRMVP
jgi:hypothetical protein